MDNSLFVAQVESLLHSHSLFSNQFIYILALYGWEAQYLIYNFAVSIFKNRM